MDSGSHVLLHVLASSVTADWARGRHLTQENQPRGWAGPVRPSPESLELGHREDRWACCRSWPCQVTGNWGLRGPSWDIGPCASSIEKVHLHKEWIRKNWMTMEGKWVKRRERKGSKGGRERKRENLPWLLNDFLFLMLLLLACVRYYYILPVNSSYVSLEGVFITKWLDN